MRVIGIDPSMTSTGLCAWDGTTSTVKTNAKQRDNRLRVIRGEVGLVARAPGRVLHQDGRFPVDLAVVELPPPGLKGSAIPALHMVQGIVRVALMDAGVPYVAVLPQYVKAYAGWARNDKDAMMRAAYEAAGVEFANDDECDAWWLREMARDHYGLRPLGSVRVAPSQRAWLDKIEWPDLDAGTAL